MIIHYLTLVWILALSGHCTWAADWPTFRGNPLQTGVATSKLPERLEVLWKIKLKDAVESTAAIVKDTVYVAAMDGTLVALDFSNGTQKWSYKGGPFKAGVSVREGAVYIGDCDGMFHGLDASTGKKRWTFETGAEISSGANFAGDSVLFGSGDEHLYCLTKDGKQRWKFRVPGGPVMGSPAVVSKRTFVAGCDSSLHVLDLDTGKEVGNAVDLGGQVGATGAVSGDHIYVGTMSNQVVAVNWKKSEIAWQFESNQRRQPFYSSAAVSDKLVIIGSRDKRVYGLDRRSGTEAWSFQTKDRVDGSPVLAGRRVYIGSLDGNLYILDLDKGTQIQKVELGSAVLSSPAVAHGRLIIGTEDGTVYCLGERN